MGTTLTYRVLVVDDFERWRRHIVATLQSDPRWHVVGEAADGLEAVEQARTLKPDLILLDVGLPVLDGIEAGRRMLASDPSCRILFFSEHRSRDIVDAALGINACGYVVKSQAGRELHSAMEAAIAGKPFVSAGLAEPVFAKGPRKRGGRPTRCHEIGFYAEEASLLDAYAGFVSAALEAGKAAILVANGARRQQVHDRLSGRGLDLDRAIEDGRYLSLDVAEVLASFMVDGRFDDAKFLNAATAVLRKAAQATGGQLRVAACGDGAATLLSEGRVDEALRCERLWDELARIHHVDVFCGYTTTATGAGSPSDDVQRICAEHSTVHSG
jgi:DNA-binding NarL/FixJ family response regulator